MTPSRFSGWLRSLTPVRCTSPRVVCGACTEELIKLTVLPRSAATPTVSASIVTPFRITAAVSAARMPVEANATSMPVTVVSARKSGPV